MKTIKKELVIVGGGPAGYAAAVRAARNGMSVALVESENLGGACLNWGCIPTKTLLESSHLFSRVCSGEFGITGGLETLKLDMEMVVGRKDHLVQKLSQGIGALLEANGVERYKATAAFTGDKTLTLTTGEKLQGQKILLALGAEPVFPQSIRGVDLGLSSEDILAHRFGSYATVAVVGGGVIGVEMATFFSDLGSQVTILEGLPRILSPFSEDVSKYVGMSLRRSGVKVVTQAQVEVFQREDGNKVGVVYKDSKAKDQTLSVDLVIVCVGRKPRRMEGLELCGIQFDRGIVVDSQGRTGHPDIYAAGDCVRGAIQLAHFATAQALSVVDNLAGKTVHTDLSCIPSCVYTAPPVAKVGLSEEEALAAGRVLEMGRFNLGGNGKSLIAGEERGYMKVIFEKGTEILLGVELVSGQAPEIIGPLGTLVAMKARRSDILKSVYPHPSVSEGFFEAVEDSIKQAIHVIYRN